MTRVRFVLGLLVALGVCGAAAVELASRAAGAPPWRKADDADTIGRVVVLGFDGVDPRIVEEYLSDLPAFRTLRERGGVHELQSEIPPESPVAWAAMLTGVNPGKTGITDFVSRDPTKTPEPGNGMVDVKPPRFLFGAVPVRPARVTSRLDYPTFLERVAKQGYPVLALRQPLAFPVQDVPGATTLAGLGTPDLAGSNGLYALYDSGFGLGAEITPFDGHRIRLEGGAAAKAFDTYLEGPFDPTGVDERGGRRRITVPLRFERAGGDGPVSIEVGGHRETVPVGGQTSWMRVPFDLPTIPPVTLHGRARFLVRNAEPLVVLSDPIQIDPQAPALPISSPGYSAEIERRYGAYKTTGWMEQTFQLNDRSTTEERFLADLLSDMDHGRAVLLGELARGAKCVFYVFTQTDRASHCFFWRRDKRHPAYDLQQAAALPDPLRDVYKRMDAIVGDVLARLGPKDVLIVASDHGFQSWRRGMNVNQWLMDNGYLVASDAPEKTLHDYFRHGLSADVDWTQTRAYALGLGQIYLNRRGREPTGIVSDAQVAPLLAEIEKKLLAYKDPIDGTTSPIRKVYRLHDLYTGPHVKDGAELQLAFGEGYRISWQTALLGGMRKGGPVCEDNAYAWSGDHCSTDRDLVPGVLLTNRALPPARKDRPYQVRDVAATVLHHFHVPHDDVEGAPLPIDGE